MTPPVELSAGALSRYVDSEARALGFTLVGIAPPDPSQYLGFYRRWLADGRHGEMGYLARPDAVARRADLRETLATVRSVVVVGQEYLGCAEPAGPPRPDTGLIARYARGRDYHRVVKGRLLDLLERLEAFSGSPIMGRVYVDTGPILERELAARAGLGWFGKNTMLIHPRRGSWFFLGALLLDLELEPDTPFTADHCGSCRRCLDACPTGALLGRDPRGAPVMDATRCISYLTIEHRGPIPRELRPALENRILGCDVCQDVCPFNARFAQEAGEPGYAARRPGEFPVGVEARPGGEEMDHPGTESPSLIALMRLSWEQWDTFTRGSAIRRAGYAGFKRNVAVALGNWAAPEAMEALVGALGDPEPLVRGHAAWALGRVGSGAARDSLASALSSEDDPFVREELELALAELGLEGDGSSD